MNVQKTADELRREYHRRWRAKNKDKIKGYNSRYWERRAEELKHKEVAEQELEGA